MRTAIWVTLVWLFLVLAFDSYGLVVVEVPLEKKVSRSTVVVIARAESEPDKDVNFQDATFASFVVKRALKGNPPRRFKLLVNGSVSELNLICCTVGKTYILFLSEIKKSKGYFTSVNGRFGVYDID